MSELLEVYPSLADSYRFAKEKHEGQFRMGGLAYITHPFEVANILFKKGYSLDYLKTAFYHDLFEDTNATEIEILDLSNRDVLEAVYQLTKEKIVDMVVYLSSMGYLAKPVKLADRLHNLRSALVAPVSFRLKYILETEKYYLDFSKDTDFEFDIKEALEQLKESVK